MLWQLSDVILKILNERTQWKGVAVVVPDWLTLK
jgi:hypothetical protein